MCVEPERPFCLLAEFQEKANQQSCRLVCTNSNPERETFPLLLFVDVCVDERVTMATSPDVSFGILLCHLLSLDASQAAYVRNVHQSKATKSFR